jgi:hypothetical protein
MPSGRSCLLFTIHTRTILIGIIKPNSPLSRAVLAKDLRNIFLGSRGERFFPHVFFQIGFLLGHGQHSGADCMALRHYAWPA